MRKNMETRIEELNDKKKAHIGDNVSLRAKYDVIAKHEKDSMEKLDQLEHMSITRLQQLDNDYRGKYKERNELEALNRATTQEISSSEKMNNELDYSLQNDLKTQELNQKIFESSLKLREELNKAKTDEYLDVDKRINALNNVSSEDPVVQLEFKKNGEYKERIENLEKDLLTNDIRIEELEIQNDYLAKKKEQMITERKKLISLNEELKREIEQKNQLNDMRIQKKVKENNSEEISKQEETLKKLVANGEDFEKKIYVEYNKSKTFASEIIKLNIEINKRLAMKEKVVEVLNEKYKEVDELKEKAEGLKEHYEETNNRLSKAHTQNEILKNRNKMLSEEHASIVSRLKYITDNFDTSSNLKRISVEDMQVLTQTNSMVNDSINAFVNKVGVFKSTHVPKNIFE